MIRTIATLFFIAALSTLAVAQATAPCQTMRQYLSGQGPEDATTWEFMIDEGRNSGHWTTIKVPSNWEFQGFGAYHYGDGTETQEIGLYRKRFSLPALAGCRVILVFQGVMTDTEVKVNGQAAGPVHQGGFTAFHYEITDLVKAGENLLEVKVSKMSSNASINASERMIDSWVFGGIFRPVYLELVPAESIGRVALDARMDGSFTLHAFLRAARSADRLRVEVETLDGHAVGPVLEAVVSPGAEQVQVAGKFAGVKLWSHEEPNRYRARITLLSGGKPLHVMEQCFGFRTFEERAGQGFFLNGRRLLLKGIDRHCLWPDTGRTLSRKQSELDVRLIREMNCNLVRCSHYAPDEHFLDLCDEIGLLVADELCAWHKPLETEIGRKLVRELVVRDVNHPCVILWDNGNHSGFNPDLESEFYKWDIQRRRVLHLDARNAPLPLPADPRLPTIDTRYYPPYATLLERLRDKNIVAPFEAVHALYDGGGGASLYDYWEAIRKSPVGGGLCIWAYLDEGIIRTDQGGAMDTAGDRAPDGVVGPYREKEGSFYTIREIWSPIHTAMKALPAGFNGTIPIENRFTFVNLNRCRFEWSLVHFSGPSEDGKQHQVISHNDQPGPDIAPGQTGMLQLNLPVDWRQADALMLTGRDDRGEAVWTGSWPIRAKQEIVESLVATRRGPVQQRVETDQVWVSSGKAEFTFDRANGVLKRVRVGDRQLTLSNGPRLVFGAAEKAAGASGKKGKGKKKGKKAAAPKQPVAPAVPPKAAAVRCTAQAGQATVEVENAGGMKQFKWTVLPGGVLKLDYEYTLPPGDYDYFGIALDLPESKVKAKRWLGAGPYRVWKNRPEGGVYDVWQNDYNRTRTGSEVRLVYPEFKGIFADWCWARFSTPEGPITLATADEENWLGVERFDPGPGASNAGMPADEALYLLRAIPSVGEKNRPNTDICPPGQATTRAEGIYRGRVYFLFD